MQAPIFQNWKRLVSALLSLTLSSTLVAIEPASAATLVFQKQGNDNYEPAGEVRYDHETRGMSVEVYDDNKDLMIVRITFASNVSNTSFASPSTLLRVKFMPSLTNFRGNTGNIWLESPKTPYQGSTKIPAVASSYATEKSQPNDPRKDMSACGALTWLDDVPSRNMVSFQFSRNCFDLPNTFWAVSQVETDMFNGTIVKDIRYTPIEPFYVDAQSVPKPPKVIPKKNQVISAYTDRSEYTMDNSAIQIVASSSERVPLSYASRTPTTCAVSSSGVIEPRSAGTCQIAVDAAGSETLNPAPTVFVSINLVKKSQTLYFDPPGTTYLDENFVSLAISSEFGLPVQVTSTSPSICTFPYPTTSPTTAQLLRSGTCSFKVTQPGNNIYNPREGFASFYIEPSPSSNTKPTAKPNPTAKPTAKPNPTAKPKPKPSPTRTIDVQIDSKGGGGGGSVEDKGLSKNTQQTIKCVKGKETKTIIAINPKCPAGYKKK